ncbi:uncharacterized protein LOC121736192 [Aricia agestis]|uniref:uncharacterized protein LOC121736192 n=1 Tax=Aricia agestis TaxID=91739 RepID=UPI001C2055A2|nr:uncharacterized protein LOC121736192 [Aricia agestis]
MFKLIVLPILFLCAESLPIDLDSDSDLGDLSYSVEEEDLDDYYSDDEANKKEKASGFKKKSTNKKGTETSYDYEDLKNYLKSVASHDAGTKNNGDVFGFIQGLITNGVGIKGNETRKYRKGTKTRGFHRVHHKDEYKKDKEIYEDDETSGVIKKVGAKGLGIKVGGGAAFDRGFYHHDRHKGLYGKERFSGAGNDKKQYSGYNDSQGLNEYFQIKKK